jgi:hypothetical protein
VLGRDGHSLRKAAPQAGTTLLRVNALGTAWGPKAVATLRSVFRVIETACSERFSAANTRLARSVVTDRVASNPCVDVRPRA